MLNKQVEQFSFRERSAEIPIAPRGAPSYVNNQGSLSRIVVHGKVMISAQVFHAFEGIWPGSSHL